MLPECSLWLIVHLKELQVLRPGNLIGNWGKKTIESSTVCGGLNSPWVL